MPDRENPQLNDRAVPGINTCGTKPQGINFTCTRAVGHPMPHKAHRSDGDVVWMWGVPDLTDPEAIDLWLST